MDAPRDVDEVMTYPVIAVQPGIAAADVARELARRRIGAVPVVDPALHVLGVIAESDVLADRDSLWTTARDVMSSPAVTVAVGTSADQARALLLERGIGRLPVVDADGRMVGIVSRRDLLAGALPGDRRIRRAVIDRAIDVGAEIYSVTVTDGTVRIRGHLAGRSQIPVLEHVLRRIPGVSRLEPDFDYDVDDTAVLDASVPQGRR
jgi:CBS-domain-containing membrane protein